MRIFEVGYTLDILAKDEKQARAIFTALMRKKAKELEPHLEVEEID